MSATADGHQHSLRAYVDFPEAVPPGGAPVSAPQRLRAWFDNPTEILTARVPGEVPAVLAAVERHARAGRWCVGGLAYEAATTFDPALTTHAPTPGTPLAWFGVFDAPAGTALPAEAAHIPRQARWGFETTRDAYLRDAARAQLAMASGEAYQINLTTGLQGALHGAPLDWMHALRAGQPDGYLLWLDGGPLQVLSASPELFFDWRPGAADGANGGGTLTCKPMKGTAARDADPARDRAARDALLASDKERAENVMIVDLLRNDLGRLAPPGAVRVQRLFEAEAWPTVWQMTSTVTAQARAGTGLVEVFQALFPCGSITGTPKARAMHWIRTLEDRPRGFYCGALGVVRPGGHATFNVPIRTLVLQPPPPEAAARPTATTGPWLARYGVGSGLTVYAQGPAEWEELMAKSLIVHRASAPFSLLETLRLEHGRYARLPRHLERLGQSARHFGIPLDGARVQACLDTLPTRHATGLWRVRLTVSASGEPSAESFALQDTPQPVRVALAPAPLETTGALQEFIRHKTTRRDHYEALAPTDPAVFDHLLVNERGELTEFTRGNLALRRGGEWLTPALSSGLLPGTYRAELLAEGRLREAVLTADDLQRADGLAFFNGLRGWLAAHL
ncbi:chorismate-binding protein [Hydrogenophaga electricum]|uniref:Aminodeoxychorismate synthase, component I n=1 Tax=Hydrogenophaga electricum TaxID=1230953 RepID=A0ABQ6C254_9BURK|nr:chorismate-binding protein [Hydrogenophaga electricum]GLS13079.1 aminodeoxychorismate synthase, component I [Hydrogenophaga electricum]